MNGVLDEIRKESGLVGFFLVGGPEPQYGGDLVVMT